MDDVEAVRTGRVFLSEIVHWPGPAELDLEGWISNFAAEDADTALHLLNAHVHLNYAQIEQLTISTFRALSSRAEFGTAKYRAERWGAFLDQVLVTYPEGRTRDVTASGPIYGRMLRIAGIPEARVLDSESAVVRIRKTATPDNPISLVFVDDLTGSGTQFRRNWTRKVATSQGSASFENLAQEGLIDRAYYIPNVATEAAVAHLTETCPLVVLAPTYLLDERYSLGSENPRLISPKWVARVKKLLEEYAPSTGASNYGSYGYQSGGLALSFAHGCPNNTVPVLQWRAPATNWRSLVS